jgi:A/G-specific adenine glycosylase
MEEQLDREKVKWFRRRIRSWAKTNLREFPWRHTRNPYRILLAEFLLQQTDAPKVVPIYLQFVTKYPTLSAMAEASVPEAAEILKPLGLHYRAPRLQKSAQIMMSDPAYGRSVPGDESLLLKLPGVGRYIARSVCAQAFDQPLAALDTNIARILERFFGLKRRRPRVRDDPYFWEYAQRCAPSKSVGLWNMALVDFGALVCRFRSPQHSNCPLRQRCVYFTAQAAEQYKVSH